MIESNENLTKEIPEDTELFIIIIIIIYVQDYNFKKKIVEIVYYILN